MCPERGTGWGIWLAFDKRILRWFSRKKREGYYLTKGKCPEVLSSPF